MKFVHVFAFVALALWFLLSGVIGLGGVVATPAIATVLNILALVAGVLFLVSVGKSCCCSDHCCGCKCDKCDCHDHHHDVEKK